jgi:hypothetical protein
MPLTLAMTAALDMGTNLIKNVVSPSVGTDAANKNYVDNGLGDKLDLSGGTMTGAIDMGGNQIDNLGDPNQDSDALTQGAGKTLFLQLDGSEAMTGILNAGSNVITGVSTPTQNSHAANKTYVDNGLSDKVDLAGDSMTGQLVFSGSSFPIDQGGTDPEAINMGGNNITGLGEPYKGSDAAPKSYVDAISQSLDIKESVRVATTTKAVRDSPMEPICRLS